MKAFLLFVKNNASTENICLFIIRWGIYLSLFTPLVLSNKIFFPFVAPKTIFFRIVVEIMLAAYVLLVSVNRKQLPKLTPLFIALTIFLEVFLLTSLTGVNFERSFWSTFERMTGFWTMLHLYAFFIILASCFKTRQDWQKFMGACVLVGAAVSAYFLIGSQAHTRSGATIGNSSFMAAYLLFDIFFAMILFLSNFLKRSLKAVFLQSFSGLSLILMVYVLANASAKAALVFFLVGLLFMALGYLLFSRQKKLKLAGLALVLVLFSAAVTLAVLQPDFLSGKIDETVLQMKSRLTVWQIGFNAWQERLIFGWGPENFYVPFSKYFNPCLFLSECGNEIWFDRAHNIVIDTAVAMGLLGLVSYFGIFAAAFWQVFRILLKTDSKREVAVFLGAAALLIAYFGQNLLVFDMINTYLVFFLSLAFINSFFVPPQEVTAPKKLNPLLAVGVFAVLIPALWLGNIQPAVAGHYAVRMIASRDIKIMLDNFQKSLDTLMYKNESREIFAQALGQIISGPVSDGQSLFKAVNLAEQEMEKGIRENPLDFRQHLFLSKLYSISYRVTGLKEKLDLAESYAQNSLALGQTSPQGYWQMGEVKLVKGEPDAAIDFLKKAIDLEPKYAPSRWYLAMAYKYLGRYDLVKEEFLKLAEMGHNWTRYSEDLTKAIEVFQVLQDYERLIPLYQKALEFNPDDVKIWGYLAASYYQLGRYEEARDVALQAKKKFPDLALEIENYLSGLPE